MYVLKYMFIHINVRAIWSVVAKGLFQQCYLTKYPFRMYLGLKSSHAVSNLLKEYYEGKDAFYFK